MNKYYIKGKDVKVQPKYSAKQLLEIIKQMIRKNESSK